jgi:hypothetical protein
MAGRQELLVLLENCRALFEVNQDLVVPNSGIW